VDLVHLSIVAPSLILYKGSRLPLYECTCYSIFVNVLERSWCLCDAREGDLGFVM
jgi:hypothetical protein